jgi:hypothetical protein
MEEDKKFETLPIIDKEEFDDDEFPDEVCNKIADLSVKEVRDE